MKLIHPGPKQCAVAVGALLLCSNMNSTSSFAEQRSYPALLHPSKDARIIVHKSKRKLEFYSDEKVVRSYRVGLGSNPVGDKEREGDGRTPEGNFYIFVKNPKSSYYLSLGISYPNVEDARRGLRDRLISKSQHDAIIRAIRNIEKPPQDTPLGGLIYIHGNGARSDWTLGCVALENENMKELFDLAFVGMPVTIKP